MNKLERLKNRVAKFSDKKFGVDRSYKAPLHHMKEEVDEVIEDPNIVEHADILLLLLDSFRKTHPDLTTDDLLDAAAEKMSVNETRNWGEPDENGVYSHI